MKKLLLMLCIASGLIATATFTMETAEKPFFSIRRYENRDGQITYIHDKDKEDDEDKWNRHLPIKHFWYYGATYDAKNKTYRSFDDGVSVGSHIVRRPFHASEGPAGSHAAQCYATLKQRYEKQEASKAQEKKIEPSTAPAMTYLQSWINYLSQ